MILLGINAAITLVMIAAASDLNNGRGKWRYWAIVIGIVLLQNLNYIAGTKGW